MLARVFRTTSASPLSTPALARRRGATLIETVVVVTLLGVLAGVAITHLTPVRLMVAERTLEAQLQQIGRAQLQHHLTHGTWAPTLEDLDLALPVEMPLLVQQPLADGYRLVVGHTQSPVVCAMSLTNATPTPDLQCARSQSDDLGLSSVVTDTDIIYTLSDAGAPSAQVTWADQLFPLIPRRLMAQGRIGTSLSGVPLPPRHVIWQTSTGDRIVTTPAPGTAPTLVMPRIGTALATPTAPPVRVVVLEPSGAVRQSGMMAIGGVWAPRADGSRPRPLPIVPTTPPVTGPPPTGTGTPTPTPPRQTDLGADGRITTWDTTLTKLPSVIPPGYTFPANPTTGLDLGNGVILPMATSCLPDRRAIRALLSEEQYTGGLALKTSQYLAPFVPGGGAARDRLSSLEAWMFRLAIRGGYVAPTARGLDVYLGWHGDGYWGRPEPFRSFVRLFYDALATGRLTEESVLRSEATPMPTTSPCGQ